MNRVGFKMKLLPGYAGEYKRRHDEIWPDLIKLLKGAGMKDYSIFLEEDTNELFAIFTAEDTDAISKLAEHQLMQDWWKYMSDISVSNADNSPLITPFREVFYLP